MWVSFVPYSGGKNCMFLSKYASKSTWKFKVVNVVACYVFILLITGGI